MFRQFRFSLNSSRKIVGLRIIRSFSDVPTEQPTGFKRVAKYISENRGAFLNM